MRKRVGFVAGIASLLCGFFAGNAGAVTINVTTTDDTSAVQCTLRDAIAAANDDDTVGACPAGDGADKIRLKQGGTITLGEALPDIRKDLSIEGPGSDDLEIDAGDAGYRVLTAPEDFTTVSISGLALSEGVADGATAHASLGGGLYTAGTMSLDDVIVTNNDAEDSQTAAGSYAAGGGIYNDANGNLTITNSRVEGNRVDSTTTSTVGPIDFGSGEGGGIANKGSLTVSASTIAGNSVDATAVSNSQAAGGGIGGGGPLTMASSTVSGNSAEGTSTGLGANALTYGGGLARIDVQGFFDGDTSLDRVTIAGNSLLGTGGAGGGFVNRGGGIAFYNGGDSAVKSSTIVGNAAPGINGGNLVYNTSGAISFENTIVANSLSGFNCNKENGTITSLGHNLSSDGIPVPGGNCNFDQPTDQINTDPELDILESNGGPTETMAPLSLTSPIVDHGQAPAGQVTDQRGLQRTFDFTSIANNGDGTDIGAYEQLGLQPDPAVLDFGVQRVETTSLSRSVTLTNATPSSVVVGTATLSGADAGDFAIETDGCDGETLSSGGTCGIEITFSPEDGLDVGRSATLGVPNGAGNSLEVSLAGEAGMPLAQHDPPTLEFDSQEIDTQSAPQSVTVENAGAVDLTVDQVELTGPDATSFSFDDADCTGGVIEAGNSCDIAVRFAPTTAGAKSASLEIESDGGDLSTALSGTATEPAPGPGPGGPSGPAGPGAIPGPTGQRAAALKKCKKKKSKKARKKCRRRAKRLPV